MLILVTSNPAKYAPFARELERMRITLEPPPQPLPEIQASDFEDALSAKAKAAAAMFGRPVLVDDAGLVLEAYAPFPGPLTAAVLNRISRDGLARLLSGVSQRARMECHIGCWVNGSLQRWSGVAVGRLELSTPELSVPKCQIPDPVSRRMLLSEVFVPDDVGHTGVLLHRARALTALEKDAFALHLELAPAQPPIDSIPPEAPASDTCFSCPFCAEFEEDGASIFASHLGDRLGSRIIYEDEHFVIMPPLGEFIEGGLLLLSRAHLLSFARLPAAHFSRLERLVEAVCGALLQQWGVSPLVFEHGPAPERSKGVCCVDHAHFNIFPARVPVHRRLADRMHAPVRSLSELQGLRDAEFGYLFVQENGGDRRVYDGCNVPTQLVRRIITRELGMPERWHWRDYPGHQELLATFEKLKGRIRV
jgi:hypothetical protein